MSINSIWGRLFCRALCNNMLMRDILQLLIELGFVFWRKVRAVLIKRCLFWYVIDSSGLFIEYGLLVFTSKKWSWPGSLVATISISPYFE